MASKPICWPPPPNCVNNFWLFINSREWEKYAGSRTFATNVKSNHDGQHGISFDIAPPFQTIQKKLVDKTKGLPNNIFMVDGASTYFSPKNVSSFYEWEVRATRTRESCGGKNAGYRPQKIRGRNENAQSI